MSAVVHLPRPVLSPDLRKRCEQTIEWLVALLDAVDTPGADLEPSLGSPEQRMTEVVYIDGAWSTRVVSQDDWAASGDTGDREGDLADTADDSEGGDILAKESPTFSGRASLSRRYQREAEISVSGSQ